MANPLIYVIFETFYSDWMLGITSFICLWCVFNIFLPRTQTKRKIISLIVIELFEHILIPIAMIGLLFFTEGAIQGILFHSLMILFIFGFIGGYLVRSKTAQDWFNILIIGFFVYLFVVFYPYILVMIQMSIPWLNGIEIMIITNVLFILSYLIYKFKYEKNTKSNINTNDPL
jgi:hypothetical protein